MSLKDCSQTYYQSPYKIIPTILRIQVSFLNDYYIGSVSEQLLLLTAVKTTCLTAGTYNREKY